MMNRRENTGAAQNAKPSPLLPAQSQIGVAPELEDLAEQIGEFIEYWGFKKVHGRIWTHLFLSDTPLDATELIRRLGISKALASMSLAELVDHGVIYESGKGKRGTILYAPNLNLTQVILNVLRKRERRMLARIAASFQLLKELSADQHRALGIDRDRMKMIGKLIENAPKAMDRLLAALLLDVSALIRRFRIGR